MCKLDWNIDFFLDNQFISKYYSPESVSVSNAEKNHGENIRNGFIHAFESLAKELNKQGIATNSDKDSAKNKTEETEEDDYLTSFDRDKYASKLNAITNRDVKALGYQIGGFNLIGFDYEYRVSDILGVHFGAGLVGYTGGIKVHSNAEKMGPFFNLSWKDAGFGQMNGVGLEYGSHLGLSKKSDFGLMLQLGLFGITHITRQFRQTIFGASRPALIFSFGLGFAW